jgi:hypothetical protein
MIEHSPDIAKLCAALHTAQGQVSGVVKDAKNPHFKNRYATLEAVIEAAKPALQAHGLSFTQAPGALVDGALEITTMLMHSSGQWLRSTLHVPLQKRDPQGVGSAITYGSRYALMAALGMPPVDDDAEGAVDRSPPRTVAPAEPRANEPASPVQRDEQAARTYLLQARQRIEAMAQTEAELRNWWTSQGEARRFAGLTQTEVDDLRDLLSDRLEALKRRAA